MYHIFFIHSSVGRPLDCFHVLAIVNSAAMNTEVHLSFQIKSFCLFGIYIYIYIYTHTGVELLGQTVALFLVCLRNLHSGCPNLHSRMGYI